MTAAAARPRRNTQTTARIILWANACHSAIAAARAWPRTRSWYKPRVPRLRIDAFSRTRHDPCRWPWPLRWPCGLAIGHRRTLSGFRACRSTTASAGATGAYSVQPTSSALTASIPIMLGEAAIDQNFLRRLLIPRLGLAPPWVVPSTHIATTGHHVYSHDDLTVGGRAELDVVCRAKAAVGHLHHRSVGVRGRAPDLLAIFRLLLGFQLRQVDPNAPFIRWARSGANYRTFVAGDCWLGVFPPVPPAGPVSGPPPRRGPPPRWDDGETTRRRL